MLLPLLLAVSFQEATVRSMGQPFSTATIVASPDRIAATPKIDGVLDPEEWDPLTTSARVASYFQWEPGKLHFAGRVPKGTDLLVSIDFGLDGWLFGANNYEFRISRRGGNATVVARMSDATNPNGPRWVDLPSVADAANVDVASDGTTTTFEATLTDPGTGIYPQSAGRRLGIRFDTVPEAMPPIEPFIPRVLAPIRLVLARDAGLPEGTVFNPEGEGTAITPGEAGRIRLTFRGKKTTKLENIALRTEGEGRLVANQLTSPFPAWDSKGRAFVDYSTSISDGATEGYRILRGELAAADGVAGIVETCYRIAPVVDCRIVRDNLQEQDEDRTEKLAFYVESNSQKYQVGKVMVDVPEPFRAVNGNVKTFSLGQKERIRRTIDMMVPGKVSGTFPIQFHVQLKGRNFDQIGYITIRPQ